MLNRLISRPLLASLAVLVPLLILVAPALGLNTGTIDSRFLDKGNKVREDTLIVANAAGPGWASPYSIIVTNKDGPITDKKTLATIASFQKRLAHDPGVDTVIGPALLAPQAKQVDNQLGQDGQIGKLGSGLRQANAGVARLRLGMVRGSDSARRLQKGYGQAYVGASQLNGGLQQASAGLQSLQSAVGETASGSRRLAGGIAQVDSGAAGLASAAGEAKAGADKLAGPAYTFKDELQRSQSQLDQLKQPPTQAVDALQAAKAALDGATLATKADPQFQSAYEQVATALGTLSGYNPLNAQQQVQAGYYGMISSLERVSEQSKSASVQASKLSSGVNNLSSGLGKLSSRNTELASGANATLSGVNKLRNALAQVDAGAAKLGSGGSSLGAGGNSLTSGLSSMRSGAGGLAHGLKSGHAQSAQLQSGVKKMSQSVPGAQTASGDGGPDTRTQSGYLTLAALQSASPIQKRDMSLVINTAQGGDSARMFVMTNISHVGPEAAAFSKRLQLAAAQLQRETGKDVRVAGRSPVFDQFAEITAAKRVPAMVALSLVSLLFLIMAFRSILLAVKAVILNLLTVGVGFGVVALLFDGSHPVLGGPGWMEAITFYSVYVVVFTLSMDYEIFIINRMREAWLRTGNNELAIQEGVTNTAGIITGAATVMIVLFSAVATFGLAAMRQFGIALVVAILVDATVIRLILLPATMRLFGKANWWLPKWLDRVLPTINMHGKVDEVEVIEGEQVALS